MNGAWNEQDRLPIAILIDVDGTLASPYQNGVRELRATAIPTLRLLAKHAPVFLWSIVGSDNAQRLVREFPDLESIITGCYGKDDFPLYLVDVPYAIDDEGVDVAVLNCNHVVLDDCYNGGEDNSVFVEAAHIVIKELRSSRDKNRVLRMTEIETSTATGRTFVITDIHGCCRTFRQLLFLKLELQKSDTLYLLGDYIDRGPDSKGVIDTILNLQRDGYDVRTVKGNHEQMLIEFVESGSDETLDRWLDNGGAETLQSYGAKDEEFVIPSEHLDFIKALPAYIATEAHIFVHAGLNFTLDAPVVDTSQEFMLWSRKNVEVDSEKIGGRKVIAGHTPRFIVEIAVSLETNFIQLDNGCYMKDCFRGRGNLVALELSSNRLYIQKNIDE
ncbi:MAG: metallophosphoesterase family protein [Desulfuromonadales bacterium]